MNDEKIKQLKDQARDFYLQNEDLDLSSHELHRAIETKFAELIIKNCINIVEQLQDDMDRQNWPTPYCCAEAIREHFGVE